MTDWIALRTAAVQAASAAYCPYSGLQVGAAAICDDGRLVAVACRSGTGELLMPCGRCRQVIYEFGGPDCLLDTPRGVLPMAEVLPVAFGPDDLP